MSNAESITHSVVHYIPRVLYITRRVGGAAIYIYKRGPERDLHTRASVIRVRRLRSFARARAAHLTKDHEKEKEKKKAKKEVRVS